MEYFNNAKTWASSTAGSGMTMLQGDSTGSKIAKVVVAIILVFLIIRVGNKLYKTYTDWVNSSPWLVKGTKIADKRMVIPQDPSKENSITLGRSQNEKAGLEFSYSFWIYINDWGYKHGQWKHVFHKGNENSWPLRAPAVFLHPKKNAMRVYMNTFKNINEFADINDLPLNKWFHVTIGVRQRNLDLFVNGNIVKRHTLEGIPKQNYGDVYINAYRGFGGFLSGIRYFDYYLSYKELDDAVSKGPSTSGCVDSDVTPPYFSPNWWLNSK